MKQLMVNEVIYIFKKTGNNLVLFKLFEKTFYPIDDDSKKILLGLHRITENQLNRIIITYNDESKLQCVIFHKYDADNWFYGDAEFIETELKKNIHCHDIIMPEIIARGKYQAGLSYIPLRESIEYGSVYKEYRYLRDFIVGNNLVAVTFQDTDIEDIMVKVDTDTIMITDSYLENLDFLDSVENLQSIIIERCIVGNWDGLRHMNNLRNLYIETADLPDSSIVKNMTKLERVGLVDCNLQEILGLSDKPDLIFCDISNNWIFNSIEPLRSSENLKWLSLENLGIDSLNVSYWNKLNVLEIEGNDLSRIDNLDLCLELKILDYSFNEIEESFMYEIEWFINNNNLNFYDWLS